MYDYLGSGYFGFVPRAQLEKDGCGGYHSISKGIVLPEAEKRPKPEAEKRPKTISLEFSITQKPELLALMWFLEKHPADLFHYLHKPQSLIHELTHALMLEQEQQEYYKLSSLPDPQTDDSYLHYMRRRLCEEVVAESSVYLPRTKRDSAVKSDPPFKEVMYRHIAHSLPRDIDTINQANKENNALQFSEAEKEILTIAAGFQFLTNQIFKNNSPWDGWISGYTQDYNETYDTNHSDNPIFEPPLLPPTLARQLNNIFKDKPEKMACLKEYYTYRLFSSCDIELAAKQTQWPMFKSDIEAAALSQQQGLER